MGTFSVWCCNVQLKNKNYPFCLCMRGEEDHSNHLCSWRFLERTFLQIKMSVYFLHLENKTRQNINRISVVWYMQSSVIRNVQTCTLRGKNRYTRGCHNTEENSQVKIWQFIFISKTKGTPLRPIERRQIVQIVWGRYDRSHLWKNNVEQRSWLKIRFS